VRWPEVPQILDIYVGDCVTWVLDVDDDVHTLTSTDPARLFDSGSLNPYQTYTRCFDRVSWHPYYDELNPDFFGIVYVRAPTTTTVETTTVSTTPLPLIVIRWGQGTEVFGSVTVVMVGQTVRWLLDLDDDQHTITHSVDNEDIKFNSGTLNPLAYYEVTFNEIGTFPYYDAISNQLFSQISVVPMTSSTTTTSTYGVHVMPWPMNTITYVLPGDTVIWKLIVDGKNHTISSL